MGSLVENLSSMDIFVSLAIVGTVLFLLRVVGLFLGFGIDDLDGIDSTESFDLLSFQSISSALMMFGWTGVYARQYGALIAYVSSTVVGLFTFFLIAYLYKLMKGLVSEHSRSVSDALIGKTAKVYLEIDASKPGQVNVVIDGSTKLVNAVADEKINSFEVVEIIDVINKNLIKVKRLNS